MKSATEKCVIILEETFGAFRKFNFVQNIKFLHLCIISALLVYPVLVIVFTPILIYRQLINFLAQQIDSKCGKMLTGWDAVMASKNPYNKPLASICPYFVFTQKIDKDHIVKTFNEKVIKPNLFPNLCQRIIRRFGYYFWYKVDDFSLENHIRYLHPNSPNTPVKISEIRGQCVFFGKENYNPNRSPWEIILVPNLFDDENPQVKSCLIVKTHHCLMDGFAVANLLRTISVKSWEFSGNSPNKTRQSGFQKFLKGVFQAIQLILTGPYHGLNFMLFSNDNTEFLKDALKVKPDHYLGLHEKESPRYNGLRLKKIRNLHQVGMSSLLITLSVESIGKLIKRKCQKGYIKLPESIYLHMSFPLPSHPGKLTNHWTCVRFPVPISKHNKPAETLKYIHSQYEQIRTSVAPIVNYFLIKLVGCLPIPFFPDPEAQTTQTILLINFPGPKEGSDLFGYDWVTCAVLGKPVKGTAFAAVCQNYQGKFWIDLQGLNQLLESQADIDEMQDNLRKTIRELEKAGKMRKG